MPAESGSMQFFAGYRWLVGLIAAALACGALAAGPRDIPVDRVATGKIVKMTRDGKPTPIRADQIIVKFTAEASRDATALPRYGLPRGIAQLDSVLSAKGIRDGYRLARNRTGVIKDPQLFEKIGLDRLYVLKLPTEDEAAVWELVDALSAAPWVEYAEPVFVGHANVFPNDQRFTLQWPLFNSGLTGGTLDADIDASEAWDIETGDPGAVIAILDTGVDLGHEDLVGNVIAGYDYVNDDNSPQDDEGHGTSVAGIAAAVGNNLTGIAGVCWNCSIMPMKVLDDQGGGSDLTTLTTWVATAMMDAADNGADALNMSLGFGNEWSQALIDAADYALGVGTLPVAAAGNFDFADVDVPGALPNVIGVGGSDKFDVRAYTYGDHAEITAPGVGITTTKLGGAIPYTTVFDGSSAATPHVAGVIGLLRSADPNLNVNEVRHLIRLGADDEVGIPAEDSPGWDRFMGYGRLNAFNSISLVDGPWLALDRPHYICNGDITVALKDKSAGGSAQVTLTGSIGGDVETITVDPVTGDGYYEGPATISWVGVDGPLSIGDGKLDLQHGETVTASYGAETATAFMDCEKDVCHWSELRTSLFGDCDGDSAADPGELWSIGVPIVNLQTEPMPGAVMVLESDNPYVEVLDGAIFYGDIRPFSGLVPVASEESGFRVRVKAGAPADTPITLSVRVVGIGWDGDAAGCAGQGLNNEITLVTNRDIGAATATAWDFDDATAQGFTHGPAHGTGDLSECAGGPFFDSWEDDPVTGRAHSGAYAMRLGDNIDYMAPEDSGLISPAFNVPPSGAVLGFRTWMDSELADPFGRAFDGFVMEGKRVGDPTWSYIADASYNNTQFLIGCFVDDLFPFGTAEQVRMFAGDGAGTWGDGDTYDIEQIVNLGDFAGQNIQVRFRFGSDKYTQPTEGQGVWIDTIQVYDGYAADAWPGDSPDNLDGQGSDATCSTSYDLTWDAVPGASAYRVYRSVDSCFEAQRSFDVYTETIGTSYSDTAAIDGVAYFYAVEGIAAGSGCPTERICITGGCVDCAEMSSDPADLRLDRDQSDVVLSWGDPAVPGAAWDISRSTNPNRDLMGLPIAIGVTDGDDIQPGVQFRDVNAVEFGTLEFYLRSAGSCAPCDRPVDPSGLLAAVDGDDIVLTWGDAGVPGARWSLYREASPDTATWGAAHAADFGDGDPGQPGIQRRDVGAMSAGPMLFYLATESTDCGGESAL